MVRRSVPQPSVRRMTPFAGHAVVAGVVPDQEPLLVRTAADLARALGGTLVFGHVDTARYVVAEHPDGHITHAPMDPDGVDDDWQRHRDDLVAHLSRILAADEVVWEFRYLAGRPDRSLTHLARAVDAAVIVVGSRAPGPGARLREFVEGSVAAHLAHHQHRPVLTVPLAVVDWMEIHGPWEH